MSDSNFFYKILNFCSHTLNCVCCPAFSCPRLLVWETDFSSFYLASILCAFPFLELPCVYVDINAQFEDWMDGAATATATESGGWNSGGSSTERSLA